MSAIETVETGGRVHECRCGKDFKPSTWDAVEIECVLCVSMHVCNCKLAREKESGLCASEVGKEGTLHVCKDFAQRLQTFLAGFPLTSLEAASKEGHRLFSCDHGRPRLIISTRFFCSCGHGDAEATRTWKDGS